MDIDVAVESTTTKEKESLPNPLQRPLPEDRFALELEFVQALASPAYWHFLSTYRDSDAGDGGLLFHNPSFVKFLKYLLKTWTQPQYVRFLQFPHALYWIELFIQQSDDDNNLIAKEWCLPAFRDFAHQQQFLAWQHRHATLYGHGTKQQEAEAPEVVDDGGVAAVAAGALPVASG